MFMILLRFYIIMFHIALLFILFCIALYYYLKDRNLIRLCFLVGIFFIGAFRPQLYIVGTPNLLYFYANALFVDIGIIIIFIAYIKLLRNKKI
jgi:hypothetical protein